MTEVQSDEFGKPRRVRVQAGMRRSLAGLAALLTSLLVMIPGLPLIAAAWGWLVQRRIAATPGGTGRGLAWAAVGVGSLMTAAQVLSVTTGWRSWDRAQHGLNQALATGDDRTQRLVATFDPAVGETLDPRLVEGYQRMLDHRYGAFVEAACKSTVAGVPLISGDEPVPYELRFENATVQAEATLVPAAVGEGVDTWAKVRRLTIHDPKFGEIPFPPPAGWRPQRMAQAEAQAGPEAVSVSQSAVAEVPTSP